MFKNIKQNFHSNRCKVIFCNHPDRPEFESSVDLSTLMDIVDGLGNIFYCHLTINFYFLGIQIQLLLGTET